MGDVEPGESVRNGKKPRHRTKKTKSAVSAVGSDQRSDPSTLPDMPATSLTELSNGIAPKPEVLLNETVAPVDVIENSLRNVSLKSSKKEKLNDSQNYTPADTSYPPHLEASLLTHLESIGAAFCVKLRINQKFSQDAYLASPDQGPDFVVEGIRDRNRSLEGDEVYAIVKPKRSSRFKNAKPSPQLSAIVVGIKKPVHHRLCIGTLSPFFKNKKYSTLIPCDSRLPKLRITENLLPKGYLKHPMNYQETLFASRIVKWDDIRFACG